METTLDFLERLKAKYDGASDYRAAQLLGVTKSAVYSWRHRGKHMGDDTAVKMAELLDLHPAYVMACTSAERSESDKTISVWQQVASQYAACFALVFTGFLGGALPF